MKTGTMDHPKFTALAAILKKPNYVVVGILESLWYVTAKWKECGGVGEWSNDAIAREIGWGGTSESLFAPLIECGLIPPSATISTIRECLGLFMKENRQLKSREHKHRRRQREGTGSVTAGQWLDRLDMFDHRCAYCRQRLPLVQEHVEPLSKGGSHSIDNLVPACAGCNSRKGSSRIVTFLARGGF